MTGQDESSPAKDAAPADAAPDDLTAARAAPDHPTAGEAAYVHPTAGGAASDNVSQDVFLDGRLRLSQPRRGYRAATDPILLAAAVPLGANHAGRGLRALDLGCGVGAAALALGLRAPGLELHGLEIQPRYAALARINGAARGLAVWEGDAADPPAGLKALTFDHVLINPPYFPAEDPGAPDPGRDAARREGALDGGGWARSGLRRLRQGGRLTMIHLVERLPDILAALDGRAGGARVLPLQARAGRPAKRMILTARKDSRAPFHLAPPLVLHEGAAHPGDGDHFSAAALAVLRDLAPLDF